MVDLDIVGRRGGRIHLWLRSWDLLVVAELIVVNGRGDVNSALWQSWDLPVGAELRFYGGG